MLNRAPEEHGEGLSHHSVCDAGGLIYRWQQAVTLFLHDIGKSTLQKPPKLIWHWCGNSTYLYSLDFLTSQKWKPEPVIPYTIKNNILRCSYLLLKLLCILNTKDLYCYLKSVFFTSILLSFTDFLEKQVKIAYHACYPKE